MEENVKFNLIFPYHIDFKNLLGNNDYNLCYADNFHCHTFEEVLNKAYLEPKAFYLTSEDMEYYSKQELEFINKVKEDESKKLDNGMELVTFDLTPEAMDMLMKYKSMNNMTMEEAVVDILTKMLNNEKEV